MVQNEGKVKDFINRTIDTVKYYTGGKDSKYNYDNNPTNDELKNNPFGAVLYKGYRGDNKKFIEKFRDKVESTAKSDRKSNMIKYQIDVTNVPKSLYKELLPDGSLYKYITAYKDKVATMELPIDDGRTSRQNQKKDDKDMKKNSNNKESMMVPVQVPEDQRSLQCDSEGHLILKDSKKVDESLTEAYWDHEADEDGYYEYIKSKSVIDSDGFYTDYTMYYDKVHNTFVFIFGDNDIYNPTNTDPDWEEENEDAANEWFDSYTGFEDEDDLNWNEDEELSDEEIQDDLDAASKEWGTDKDDEADLESLQLKEGPSRLEIMKTHKAQYDKLQKKINTMPDGLDKDIAIELGLKWIKGRDWMGGISDSDANKALSKLAKKYGISEEEIDDKFDKDYVMNAVEYESLEKPKKLYHCDDCGYEVELTDDEYDGMCPHCHEHHGFYAYEDEDVNEQILNETPGLTLSTPKVTYKDQDDYEGRLEIEINGKKYMYRCNMGTDATAREMADKVIKMQKYSDGKALAYLKKNMHLVTEGVKVGDKVKVDTNFRGVNPKVKEVEITKVESGLATKDDPNPSKILTVKGKDGAEFKVDENQIVKESTRTEARRPSVADKTARELESKLESKFYDIAINDPEWDYEDQDMVDEYMMPRIEVQVDPEDRGRLIATVAAEYSDYDAQYSMDDELNKVIRMYDTGSYFEQVEPGISEAIVYVDDRAGKSVITGPLRGQDYAYEGLQLKTEAISKYDYKNTIKKRIQDYLENHDYSGLLGDDYESFISGVLTSVVNRIPGDQVYRIDELRKYARQYMKSLRTRLKKTESLKESPSYGGAFDIADDQYFTREDLDMFAEKLLDNLKIFTSDDINYEIADIDIQSGNELFVEVDAEGNSFFGKVKIDMRKIKTPASLTVKYVPEILIQIMKQIDEYNKEGFAEITLTPTARKMIGESVEVNEGYTDVMSYEDGGSYKRYVDDLVNGIMALDDPDPQQNLFVDALEILEDMGIEMPCEWEDVTKDVLTKTLSRFTLNTLLRVDRKLEKTFHYPFIVSEGLQLKTEANVIYDNPNSKEAKLVKMEQNLHVYIHQKMWKDALNMAEYIVEILKDLISDNIKTESLGPTSDGWSDKVRLIVGEVFDDCYDTQYEIDSAYRGYHTNAHTAGELADYLYGLADRLTSAAEDLQSQEEELNESKKLAEKKVSFKDVHICKGCGKPLSQCTCDIKEEDLKESVLAPGKEFTSKSGHWIKIVSVEPFVSDYNGDASLRIEYEYKTTDGREGKDTCNNWDLFNMLNESATQVSNIGQHKSSSIDLIEKEDEDKEDKE